MTTSRSPHVLCLGNANVDHVFEVDALPSGEGKARARSSRWGGGGIAPTAAASISRLGARATWCGLVGDDWPGRLLLGMLHELGVTVCDNSVVAGATTPITSVVVDGTGQRWLVYDRGKGLDVVRTPPDVPDLRTVDAVVVTESRDSLADDALRRASQLRIPRVLDAEESSQARHPAPSLLCDHIIFSEAGLASYAGVADVRTALGVAADRLPGRTIGVTLGPRGSVWKSETGIEQVGAPRVVARDTTGCGDVFHGAYALAVAEGAAFHRAVRFATAAAALKAELGCSWTGMPSRPAVERLIEKGWT